MKFLSATAVFAAALPSVTEASTSESPITITDLSSNRTGTFSSQFTEIIPEGGAEYKISGNVSFSSFSNISEEIQEPSSDPEQEENDDNDEESSLESPNTVTEENSSPETPGDNSQTSSPQEAERGPEESSSSTTTSSPSTPSEQTQNNAIALRSFLYSLQAETEETGQTPQEGVSSEEPTPPESTEEDQQGSTEEGQEKPNVQNTTSGGGAFYNNHTGPLSFVNNPENPGSLTLSKIRVTGEGGAIYSKGPLSIKDLKQLVLAENLSKKAGGAILGESTVTISGVDTLTFSKNAVEVTFVDQSETQTPSAGSETEVPSDSSNDSDHSSSGGDSSGVSSTPQAIAFSRFLSASPSTDSQPEEAENTDSSVKIELGCGGGIYSKGKLTVSNSKEISFNENSATKDGGGIYSEEDISVSTAEKVLFTGNTAGVVGKESATDKEQTPTDPEQVSPESSPDSTDSQPSSTTSARLTQLSLTLSASTEGGGSNGQENSLQQDEEDSEDNQQEEASSNESQDADQSNSETNQSPDSESPSPTPPQSPTTEVIKPVVGRGGAVYTEKSLTVTDVTQIELVNNSATGAGGAIYAADKVAFTTTASNTSDARDPGETTISDNKASGCGGGVCTKAFSASNLKTLTLSKNTSEKSGGAIYTDLDALKTPEKPETEPSTTPPSPSSPEGPAAAAKTSRFVAMTSTPKSETVVASPASDIDVFINKVLNVAITENKAAKKGGGVYGKKAKFSNLDKLDISNNTAQDIGGGLCLTESVEFDAIGSLSTSNNSAIAQGAGIHAKTVTITNTKSAFTFANNTVQATEDPEPEVTQPEENVPSEEENPSSTPNNGQNQNTSPANRQNQEQSGVEESGSEEASDVNSEQKVESEGVSDSNGSNQQESPVISPSEDNDQAEGSDSTSSSETNNGNSDSGDQNLSEESQEKSPTEETQNSTSENNAESNNNSSNTDSTASTGSTEGNQNSQTDDQENSDVNSGQEVENEGVSDSNGSNQQESPVISPSEDNDQAEGSDSTSSSETNNGNSDSGDQNLSEESQEKSPTEETQNSTSENNAESNNSSNTDSTASTGSTEENQNSQTDDQENSDVNSEQKVESEGVSDSNGSNQQESQVISPSENNDQAEGSGSTSSSENGQNQEQSGVEESGSEEASDVNSEQKVESEEVSDSNGSNQQESQVISPSENNDQAEGSGSTSSSEKNDGNSESGDQNLSEESQEKSPTEETQNSTSGNNAESNNNSSNTDSTASTGSTEGNQNSQTDDQENRDSNENESVSSSDGSEEQHTESENTNSHVPSQSDLSETNSETSEANTSEHAQNGEQTSENADSSTKENELSEVENTESSSAVSSESPTNSQEPQTTASSRVAILSSTDTVGSSSATSSTSEASGSDTSEGESESEAASPDAPQTEGSSDAPTLVAGGAIWGDTVKIENFSGNGTFSNNKVIDNKPSGSKANVLGGAIYAKTSLDINNESSNRSIIFSDNSVSSKSTVGQVAGGAIFSPTVTIKAPVVFSKNSATHEGTNPKNGGTTLKDTFGGAIGATTSVSISKGASFSENIADIGSAIGLVADAIPVDNNSGTATVSDPGTPSTTPDTQNKDTVRLEGGSYYFEKNKALKRATIYAPTVSIKAYTATFNQNSSAEEGSAIYFTKEASIESLGSVLFTGNLVTPTKSTTVISTENVKKYGAAIFGQIADTNGTQPTSQTTTDNLPLTLIASGGNISFRNNEYRPTAADIGQSTFCSIGGDVKLSMQAAEGKTISFFDAIQTTTKKTGTQASAYDTLDINKSNNPKTVNSAFTGTIMFSSELHENKSYIPQNVVLHSGSLVLKANTELHVISFEQKEGSSLIMEPGAVLSNQATADGSLVINSLTIDLSSVGTTVSSGGGLFTPPELRIVDTNTAGGGNSGAQPGGSSGAPTGGGNGGAESNPGNGSSSSSPDANNTGSGSSSTNTDQSNVSGGNGASSSADSGSSTPSSSSPLPTAASAQASITKNLTAATPAAPTAPGTTGNQVILDGVITLVDPNGTFFQNPALGSDQTISLLVLPTDSSKMQAQKVVLTGDVSPVKGYTGTLTLDLSNLQNGIQANWTFNSYRQWAYIPRDNHFYANSIIGSQMSMATVKQGLINDKLNLARFDEVAYNNLWVSGVGTMLSQRGGPRSEEMTYYSRGASVALDAKPAQDLIIGAAFSKMIGRSKSLKQEHNYTHKGSEYSYQASVYGGRPFHLVMNRGTERTLPLLLQGVISYGYIKHDTVTHYPTIRERNKGEWEDLGWLAALRLSSILKAPKQGDSKRISVFGEFEYSSIRQKQFTETEYDPRYFGNCTYRNLAIPLGIALEGEFKGNDILMYNRFSVAYMPSIYRNSPVCKYKVLSSGEGGEIICGVPTRNTSRAEYSTQLYLGPLWTLYGSYTLEADAHTLANMINCGARMTF
ncbi:polymorphic outer membrane protein middle domain-containing protein [Chlamydia suis]|uniref:polymorphic outer membrane protein middle domain-containing protein n=1 Tax=Chlamydia suis TaxID=83559 RepID=UPI0009B1650E|nr:polymorphic outer membrane protein middle domain-containing protein [Chlamydia suis]